MDMTVSPCHSNSLPDSASNTTEGAEKPEQQIERGNIHDDVTITKPRLSLILTLSDFGKNTQTRRLLVARCLIIFFFYLYTDRKLLSSSLYCMSPEIAS